MMGETGFWKTVELESPFQGTGTDPSRKISSSGKEESSHNLCVWGGVCLWLASKCDVTLRLSASCSTTAQRDNSIHIVLDEEDLLLHLITMIIQYPEVYMLSLML